MIILIAHPDGRVEIEAQGYTGKSCEEATKFLETALGKREAQNKRPEYYLEREQQQTQKGG